MRFQIVLREELFSGMLQQNSGENELINGNLKAKVTKMLLEV